MFEYEDDERLPEVIGECERCGRNIMEDEHSIYTHGYFICEQCSWMIGKAKKE